jgi:hypothetical protein
LRVVTFDVETVHPAYTGDPSKFANLPFHFPIVICWLVSDPKAGIFRVECFYGAHDRDWEREALQSFRADCMEANRLVSFNGRTFDMPVLTLRALRHRMDWQKMHTRTRERYANHKGPPFHVDLMDLLGNYGAARNFKMNEVATVLELPGKQGLDGKMIEQAYQEGRLKEIAEYCVGDVILTRLIYLRAAASLLGGWGTPHATELFQETVRWVVEKCPPLADAYRYLLATP